MYKILTKLILILSIMMSTILVFSLEVEGNSGPPINLRVMLKNIEKPFSLDILIYQEDVLSQDQIDEANTRIANEDYYTYYYQEEYPTELLDFQDRDHYVSNSLYGSAFDFYGGNMLTEDGYVYTLFLNVPRVFKLVLVNDQSQVVISEIIHMNVYDLDITWDLKDVVFDDEITYNAGEIDGLHENPYKTIRNYINMIIRLIITFMIEAGIFFLFGFRKKSTYQVLAILNTITQIGLTFAVIQTFYSGVRDYSAIFIFIFGELLVFLFEMIAVSIFVKEKHIMMKLFTVLIANSISLVLGLYISMGLLRYIF